MSDLSSTLEIPTYDTPDNPAGDLFVDAPTEPQSVIADGQPEVTEVPGSEEPEPQLLDLDSLDGQFVELKVDKEIQLVSAREAIKDLAQKGMFFTQEMQALRDQERENLEAIQLRKALQDNPEGTLRLLQNQLGVASTTDTGSETEFMTDEERKIAALEAQVGQLAQRQSVSEQQRQLNAELDSLESQVGVFDRDALLAHATNNNIIGNLRAAWSDMNFDKIAVGQDALKKQADRKSALEDKRAVATSVGRASSAATGTQQAHVEKPSTFAESYMLAVEGKSVSEADLMPSFITRG